MIKKLHLLPLIVGSSGYGLEPVDFLSGVFRFIFKNHSYIQQSILVFVIKILVQSHHLTFIAIGWSVICSFN
jgi:hypothetical protein